MPVTRGMSAALAQQAALPPPPPARDPLCLGTDALSHVLSLLDPDDLRSAALVSRGWRALAGQDVLWRRHFEAAAAGKVYCPALGRDDLPARQRYLYAVADLKRTAITRRELCAFRWQFRFKPEAGGFWVAVDPFHNGAGEPMQRLFRDDGSLCAPPGDPVWGDHENRWRLCKTRDGRRGHFVKVNHWPSLSVCRTGDGGWKMENPWVVYTALLRPGGPYSRGVGRCDPGWQC